MQQKKINSINLSEIKQINEERFLSGLVKEEAFFIQYQTQILCQKLKNLSKLTHNERKTYITHLNIISNYIPQYFIQIMIPYFQQIVIKNYKENQNDQIKRQILKQLQSLQSFFQNHSCSYQQKLKIIFNPLLTLLKQNTLDIKQDSGKLLAKFAYQLHEEDKSSIILKQIIQLAHDKKQQNRIVAVLLFSHMAKCFGQQLCEEYIGLQMLSLGQDSCIRVKKQMVQCLPKICEAVSKSYFKNKLLNIFLKKCQQINWGVRKICVQISINMNDFAQQQIKIKYIAQKYLLFLRDVHKWVRQQAYKNLGRFISTFQNPPEFLIDEYIKTFDLFQSQQQVSQYNRIIYKCAFYIPAVIKIIGQKKWSKIGPFYKNLCNLNNNKIREPLVASFHQIAMMVNSNIIENQLLPILSKFLQSKSEKIILLLLKNICKIFRNLDQSNKQNLLEVFIFLQKNQIKWRIRLQIAKQLQQLIDLFDCHNVYTFIVPIAFKLANDPVSQVRIQAAKNIYFFIKKFNQQKQLQFIDMIFQNLKGFGSSCRYFHRITSFHIIRFLRISKQFGNQYKQLYLQKIETLLKQLLNDKIQNVRIMAKEVNEIFKLDINELV